MADDSEPHDVDEQLDAILERSSELLDRCHYTSAYHAYGELGRVAKREGRAIPYIMAVFHQMDLAQYLLQPQTQRERAIELLGLIENEEAARRIQPDLPEWQYEHEAGWRTACGYENLAEAAGMIEGFNSEGMHAIIAEGLQVCRRTGKLQCIRCFREYATDVYAAAEDLDMALHQCRTIIDHRGPWSDRGDRRWLASKKAAWFLLLHGGVEQAEAMLRSGLELASVEGVGVMVEAQQRTMVELAALLVLAGRDDLGDGAPSPSTAPEEIDPAAETVSSIAARRVVEGECLMLDYRWDLVHSLRACVRGDWDNAIDLLTRWDRRLTENHDWHEWFETRLRLIAAHRLAGRNEKVERLAAPLREKASKANDWLTLRRLERLLDESQSATPLALLAPLTIGPFQNRRGSPTPPESSTEGLPGTPGDLRSAERAGSETRAQPEESAGSETRAQPEVASPEITPLSEELRDIYDRWGQIDYDEEAARAALLDQTLSYTSEKVTHPRDAARLLFLAAAPSNLESGRGPEIWRWAQSLAAAFPEDAAVLSRLASLGDALRDADEELDDAISNEQLDRLFRKALRLAPDDADSFLRAGMFYQGQGDLGEAERCYARAFRLQRKNAFAALRLAEVYQQTDRPRDALAALDLCVREGSDEPAAAWEAALTAMGLDHYDAALAYLDRYEELQPDEPNTQYYRGVALLELGRAEEALAALDEEQRRHAAASLPDAQDRVSERRGHVLHLEVIRACVFLDLRRFDAAREHLRNVLSRPLREADFLTFAGFVQLFVRLWRRAATLPVKDPLRDQLDALLLACGLMPDEFFERQRQRGRKAEVNFYRCVVRQPLGDDWPQSPGRLPGQESWIEYFAEWGVLAQDEERAAQQVLAWQGRCHPQPAQVEQVELGSEGYHDKPGVVWQGPRWVGEE